MVSRFNSGCWLLVVGVAQLPSTAEAYKQKGPSE